MATEADKRNIKAQIQELRAAIDMNPLHDSVGETNIAYLEDALKHIEHNTASNEVRIVRN